MLSAVSFAFAAMCLVSSGFAGGLAWNLRPNAGAGAITMAGFAGVCLVAGLSWLVVGAVR